MAGAHDLAAELDEAPVGQRHLLHPAADAVAGLEHGHRRSAGGQVAGGAETGQPGADDDDVGLIGCGAHRSTTACSGCQPIRTRSPGAQRSSARIRGRFCSSTVRVMPVATETRYCVVAPW